jgi:nitroreductase
MTCINDSVGTLNPDQVQQVLTTADRAPAVHHIRPWRFHCTKTTIELLLDLPAGACREADDHREAWVACGAALLNLRLAIRSCGVEPVVHLLPERDRPSLLAEVEIDGRRPTTNDGLELSLAIALQETKAEHFEYGVLPDALIVELRYAARIEQAWIALLPTSAFPALHKFAHEHDQVQLLDPFGHVLMVGTLQDDPTSRLRAGQAMQRVLLTATKSDLSACSITMSPDLRTGREQLRELIGGGLWPQALLQIGRLAA